MWRLPFGECGDSAKGNRIRIVARARRAQEVMLKAGAEGWSKRWMMEHLTCYISSDEAMSNLLLWWMRQCLTCYISYLIWSFSKVRRCTPHVCHVCGVICARVMAASDDSINAYDRTLTFVRHVSHTHTYIYQTHIPTSHTHIRSSMTCLPHTHR